LGSGPTCATIHVHIINITVDINDYTSFTCVGWSRLKPSIFKSDLLNRIRGALHLSDALLAWDSFRDQELLFLREIIVVLASIAASPPFSSDNTLLVN
jgi:hypothetical protein